jgi:cytochrome c-type biogenesis protein CcmF
MNYIGEHLLPGKLGHFFLFLSLVSSLGAAISYFLSVQRSGFILKAGSTDHSLTVNPFWKKLGRIFFITQAVSVFAVFSILFFIIYNHYFEYKYVWQHSSLSLETKYLLSCFWEGQEGSFLLWSIWHCVVGLFFISRERKWEGPVMTVVSFAQLMLATMILGVSFFGNSLGSNPFMLLRNSGVLDNAPAFFDMAGNMRQDYLGLITDGNDLNPLLQNYWMVIHPPVLFMGFASAIIPFAFAVGGLWTKRFSEWTKPALPWALFSAALLGLGIMMGAAWAYESLNFGGYWAWDPVENASLVPWLLLVAGIHTLLIYRHTGNALRTTHLFFLLGFLLVLYSTYLTRSGDLQDTSVHAFTGEGITPTHLRIFLFSFVLPSLILFFVRYKHIPFIAKEEEASSREFWMFIGSLVIFLAALLIIGMTSIPVANKIIALFSGDDKTFKTFAVGEDAAFAYNRIQIFVAIIIGFISGMGMYLKYKTTSGAFFKKILWPAVVAIILGALVLVFGDVNYTEHGYGYLGAIWLALIAAMFSMITNGSYIWTGMKGSMRRSGGSIAHVGFAMMLLGILLSSSKKEVLSFNTTGIFLNFGEGSTENPGENLTLIKGIRTKMGEYFVTYIKDSAHPQKQLWYYILQFEKADGSGNFVLTPNAFVNYKGNQGLMANPDSKNYLTHDIFTYITSLPDPDKNKDTAAFKTANISVGDTLFYSKGFAVLEDLSSVKEVPGISFGPGDSASVASFKIFSKTSSIYTVKPTIINIRGEVYAKPDTVVQESLVLQLQKVEGQSLSLGVKESDDVMQYVTLKAYKFPFINLLWLGTILTVLGFLISMAWRIKTNKEKKKGPVVADRTEEKRAVSEVEG